MLRSIRTLALGIALTTALAPLAHAGGTSASVEGPFKDGSYAVRVATCTGIAATMAVTATAEGVVAGQRKSLPVTLKSTKEKGVYQFARTWPAEGAWVVRVTPAGGRMPVTLATIGVDGVVGENELLWKSDGRHECDQKLAANTK
jgi:hypothetical protein